MSLALVHNGHAHPLPSTTTEVAGTRQTINPSISCNEVPGTQHFELVATASGGEATVAGRSVDTISATQGQ